MNFNFISDHTGLIAFLFIGGFIVWKYIIEPIQNEGNPIESNEQEIIEDS